MSNKNTLTIVGILVLILVSVLIVYFLSSGGAKTNPALDAFAQCLASKKITMYGLYSCPHCLNEKANFGSSFQYVPYVECSREPDKCNAAGVDRVPAWILPDGRKLVGEQGLEKLSLESGCPLSYPTSTSATP